MTEQQLEALGRLVDRIDNYATALVVMRTIPDRIHVEALRCGLPEIRDELRNLLENLEDSPRDTDR